MIKANPVIADGNLLLSSITEAILGNMPDRDLMHNSKNADPMYRGRGIIIKTFLVMIFAQVKKMRSKGYDPTNFSIVWDKRDKGQYYKSNIIDKLGDGNGYKGDRSYATAEDLDNSELTATERLSIEAQLVKSNERYEARNFIKDNLPKFGISSFSYTGWEADDIDFMWAIETEKGGGYHIHYSGDSDWSFHLRDKDIFWQVNRSVLHLKTVAEVRVKYKIPDHMTLMEFAEVNFAAFGSHNFLQRTFDPTVKRITKKFKDKLFSGDYSDITNVERFEVQRKCFDIVGLPNSDKVSEMYEEMINHRTTASPEEFKNLLVDLSVGDRSKHSLYNSYLAFQKILLDSKIKQI